ncbi:MAG TPA: ATP-binding protein [Myxococcales bacterium]|jgi:signal transduction histidine kinase
MGSRTSTRAQIAFALSLALLFGAGLEILISAGVLKRALDLRTRRDLTLTSQAVARCVATACGAQDVASCPVALAVQGAGPELRIAVSPRPASSAASSTPLAGGGSVTVERVGGVQEQGSATSLLAAYILLGTLFTFVFGTVLLNRLIARPLDKLASAAERIGRLELDDPLGGGAPTLGRLGGAFERMATSLKEERARVTAQITELERLNRQLGEARDSLVRSEKLATVGRLAAGVAHEVGNPLGAILGYLELAKSKAPAEVVEYLARIDQQVARIDRTVRELLDFSRPGPQDGALGPVNLREAVDAAVRLASVQQRLKHVEFDVQLPEALAVVAEPHHLGQVLVNVLLNAGDAMNGEGRVEVRATTLEPPPARRASDPPPVKRVELALVDSGPGIQPSDLPRIFDPFFTTKDPGAGTGLGLAICHRIMETFGGEIRAGNRPEGGAVFTLVFREAGSG